mgnify:CR=1 FL=1
MGPFLPGDDGYKVLLRPAQRYQSRPPSHTPCYPDRHSSIGHNTGRWGTAGSGWFRPPHNTGRGFYMLQLAGVFLRLPPAGKFFTDALIIYINLISNVVPHSVAVLNFDGGKAFIRLWHTGGSLFHIGHDLLNKGGGIPLIRVNDFPSTMSLSARVLRMAAGSISGKGSSSVCCTSVCFSVSAVCCTPPPRRPPSRQNPGWREIHSGHGKPAHWMDVASAPSTR